MGTPQSCFKPKKDSTNTRLHQRKDTKDNGYLGQYIGTIKFKSRDDFMGAGVMISRNLVLTAASNIFDRRYGCSNNAFQFYLGSSQRLCFSIIGIKYPSIFIKYSQDKGLQYNIALLRLQDTRETMHNNKYPQLMIPNSDIQHRSRRIINEFGFPLFQSSRGIKDKQALVIEPRIFRIRYDMLPQSCHEGFPIIMDGNIIGIHCHQHKQSQYNYGRLVTPDLIKILKEWCLQLKGDMFSMYGQQKQLNINDYKSAREWIQQIIASQKIQKISQNPIINLKKLNLSTKGNVKLTDADMNDFSKVRLDNLVELNLQNNRINDKGLQILCQKEMPSLHEINIEDNAITINGLQLILRSKWSDDIHYHLYCVPTNDNGYHVNVGESIPVMKKIVQTKRMETIDILIDEDSNKVLSAFKLLLVTPLEKKEANNLAQNSKRLQQQFVKAKAKNPRSIETILLQLKKITKNSLYFTNNSNVKTHLTSKIIFANLYTERIRFEKKFEKVQNFKFSDFKDNHKKLKQFQVWLFSYLKKSQGVDTSEMALDKLTEGSIIAHISDSIENASTHNQKYYNLIEDQIKYFFEDLQLSPDDFDIKRNYQFPPIQKAKVQLRGGLVYYQPVLGLRVGIKVQNIYDNGNNEWLMMDGNKDEWAIAFHGPGNPYENGKMLSIFKGRKDGTMLKPGSRQIYHADPCLNKNGSVGNGVYVSPYFLISLLRYSQIDQNTDYFIVFQCRVKPSSIKMCKNKPSYWVINQSKNLRPYGMVLFTNNQKQILENLEGSYLTPQEIHNSIYKEQFTQATWNSTYKSVYDKFHRRQQKVIFEQLL